MKNRIEWIDIAKGLGMLLVIIGHGVEGTLKGAIFSFHMPLFFILSCTTFRCSQNNDEFVRKTQKAFKRLFMAAVGIFALRKFFVLLMDIPYLISYSLPELKEYFANIINIFIAGSGVGLTIDKTYIPRFGIAWFLFGLFFGRTLFDYLHLRYSNKAFLVSIAICSILGVCLGHIQWLPFSLDIALAIQPLFLFGYWFKSFDMENGIGKKMLVSSFVWFALFILSYWITGDIFELAMRRYSLFPICFVCGIAGTVAMSCFCRQLAKQTKIVKHLMYLGQYSIVMLWIHCFDDYFQYAWKLTANDYINVTCRVVVDVVVFALVMSLINMLNKEKEKKQAAQQLNKQLS